MKIKQATKQGFAIVRPGGIRLYLSVLEDKERKSDRQRQSISDP